MSEICSSANHKKSSKTSGSEDRMQMIESIFEEYSLKK